MCVCVCVFPLDMEIQLLTSWAEIVSRQLVSPTELIANYHHHPRRHLVLPSGGGGVSAIDHRSEHSHSLEERCLPVARRRCLVGNLEIGRRRRHIQTDGGVVGRRQYQLAPGSVYMTKLLLLSVMSMVETMHVSVAPLAGLHNKSNPIMIMSTLAHTVQLLVEVGGGGGGGGRSTTAGGQDAMQEHDADGEDADDQQEYPKHMD